MQWFNARTIVLDDKARHFVDQAEKEHARFEDQWRGAEWLLARSPEKGISRDQHYPMEYLVYVIPENSWAKTRELWILYSYDEDRVIIHRARFGNS